MKVSFFISIFCKWDIISWVSIPKANKRQQRKMSYYKNVRVFRLTNDKIDCTVQILISNLYSLLYSNYSNRSYSSMWEISNIEKMFPKLLRKSHITCKSLWHYSKHPVLITIKLFSSTWMNTMIWEVVMIPCGLIIWYEQ